MIHLHTPTCRKFLCKLIHQHICLQPYKRERERQCKRAVKQENYILLLYAAAVVCVCVFELCSDCFFFLCVYVGVCYFQRYFFEIQIFIFMAQNLFFLFILAYYGGNGCILNWRWSWQHLPKALTINIPYKMEFLFQCQAL